MPPTVHTLDEAAAILKVKPSWLAKQCERRQVPFTMPGGTYHFTDAHLEWIVTHFEEEPRPRIAPGPARQPKKKSGAAPSPSGVKPLDFHPSRRLREAG